MARPSPRGHRGWLKSRGDDAVAAPAWAGPPLRLHGDLEPSKLVMRVRFPSPAPWLHLRPLRPETPAGLAEEFDGCGPELRRNQRTEMITGHQGSETQVASPSIFGSGASASPRATAPTSSTGLPLQAAARENVTCVTPLGEELISTS